MFQRDSALAHRASDTVAILQRQRDARNASSSKRLYGAHFEHEFYDDDDDDDDDDYERVTVKCMSVYVHNTTADRVITRNRVSQ